MVGNAGVLFPDGALMAVVAGVGTIAGVVGFVVVVVVVVDRLGFDGGREGTASCWCCCSVSPGVTGDIKADSRADGRMTVTCESEGAFCSGAATVVVGRAGPAEARVSEGRRWNE